MGRASFKNLGPKFGTKFGTDGQAVSLSNKLVNNNIIAAKFYLPPSHDPTNYNYKGVLRICMIQK
jgi:hypothetical protein